MDPEVKRKLVVDKGYILDPFSNEPRWIYRAYTSLRFEVDYGLTLSQVWNLANGFDKDHKHYCKLCGKELVFKGLSNGFGGFCSISCSTKYGWNNNYYEAPPDENFNGLLARAKGARSRFINSGSADDHCYFYIAKTTKYPDLIKFGITSDPDQRVHLFYVDYTDLEILKEGSRVFIAELEYQLKLYLNQWKEYIDPSQLLIVKRFIDKY